jgi:hypothetical protein
MPVPAGTSATEAISSGLPCQWRASVSRRMGWRICRTSSTSSSCEYFSRYRRWKTVCTSMYTYLSMAPATRKPPCSR